MRLISPSSQELEEAAEKIWNMAFSIYISPSRHEKLLSYANFEELPFGGGKKDQVIERIKSLLHDQHDVRAGYICTSIREYHDYFIIWKP